MNEFTLKTRIEANACDAYDRIRPSAVFTLFQNAASLHADDLGVGYEELIQKDIIWVLVRCRYDLVKSPVFEEPVEIKTYPLPTRGIDYDREYVIYDKSGNKLIKGRSKWCLCNYKTRKLLIHGEAKYNIDSFSKDRQYDRDLKKIPDFPTEDCKEFASKTYFTDLDHNGHVNNTRYLDFVLNAIADEFKGEISYLEIDYLSEMTANAGFTIFYRREGDEFRVKAMSEGREVFRALVGVRE